MTVSTCAHCGANVHDIHEQCPFCGSTLREAIESDPRVRQMCQLLDKARDEQETGDVTAAIQTARSALLLRPDCSSTHALLGQLYEQVGDHSAAREHFQLALVVDATAPCSETQFPAPAVPAVQTPQGSWMTLVLIGCVVCSGLAALFTIWPFERGERSGIVNVAPQSDSTIAAKPRWDFRVPSPLRMILPRPVSPEPASSTTDDTSGTMLIEDNPPASPSPPTPPAPVTPKPDTLPAPTVLGPSASNRMPALSVEPTLEEAEQASFCGQFERAIAIYEAVLHAQDKPMPRVHQELAWCYQQLGHSAKAEEHLNHAIQEYRKDIAADAHNTAAQQGLQTCEAALTTLHDTHDALPSQ